MKRVIGCVLVILTAVLGSFMADCLFRLDYHRERLHFYLGSDDRESAQAELNNVKYFYVSARGWKVDWLGSRFLPSGEDLVLYEIMATDYLIGDYKKVAESAVLRSSKDYRAAHLVGIAKARLLQAQYRAERKAPAAKAKALKEKLSEQMVLEVSPYFKTAVENSPEFGFPDPNFADRWNYDLTSDKSSAARLLEGLLPQPKFILGIPQEEGGDQPGRGQSGPKRLNEESQPGQGGDARKKG